MKKDYQGTSIGFVTNTSKTDSSQILSDRFSSAKSKIDPLISFFTPRASDFRSPKLIAGILAGAAFLGAAKYPEVPGAIVGDIQTGYNNSLDGYTDCNPKSTRFIPVFDDSNPKIDSVDACSVAMKIGEFAGNFETRFEQGRQQGLPVTIHKLNNGK